MNQKLFQFRPRWEETLSVPIKGNNINVIPSAGGPLIGFILNVMSGYNMTQKSIETEDDQILTFHRFIETFKYGNSKKYNIYAR